jgi:hypothetical protein
MNQIELIAEDTVEARKPSTAEVIELSVEELGDVGGGVAYVFL